jgi:GNAT superfamily N-acetyltransferase
MASTFAQHFWSNYWRSAPSRSARFSSTLASAAVPMASPPTGLQLASPQTEPLAKFIAKHFRQGQFYPTFHYQPLEHEKILVVEDNNSIVGTLRSRPAGTFEENKIYLIDLFCVRSDWRRTGVGSYLLSELSRQCANEGIHNFIFLKEGRPLNILGLHPIYSSYYVYRYVKNLDVTTSAAQEIQKWHAYKLIHSYAMLRPDTFLILNQETKNQNWFIYKTEKAWILALIQNSYQSFPPTGSTPAETLGWCCGWIESPTVTEEFRSKAAEEITTAAARLYDWIWMDQVWVGNNSKFAIDGQFHWYSYQWASSLSPGQSYIIMN